MLSSPRAAATRAEARRPERMVRAGTATPASSNVAAKTAPAPGNSAHARTTADPPTIAAISGGGSTRRNRSCSASTSATSRLSRSPLRKSARPAGASGSSRV